MSLFVATEPEDSGKKHLVLLERAFQTIGNFVPEEVSPASLQRKKTIPL